MNSKQKINLVLEKIHERKEISPKGEKLCLTYKDNFDGLLTKDEVGLIFRKLEKDEDIILDFKLLDGIDLHGHAVCEYYFYIIYSDFDKYFEKVKSELEKETIVRYRLKYIEKTCEIKVNDKLIANPRDDSINNYFFKYIYNNQEKKIFIRDIKDFDGKPIRKKVHNLLSELHFTGIFKRAFFQTGKNWVKFKDTVTQKDLDDFGVTELSIPLKE